MTRPTDADERIVEELRLFMRELHGSVDFQFYPESLEIAKRAAARINALPSTSAPQPSSERVVANDAVRWANAVLRNRDAATAHEIVAAEEILRLAALPAAPQPASAATTTDAIIKEYRGESPRGLAIALADHARFLEGDVARWKRLYECAQNANSFRQDALDAIDAPQSESGAVERDAARYRWLRDKAAWLGFQWRGAGQPPGLSERSFNNQAKPESIDTAIDTAMLSTGNNGSKT